MGPLGQSPGSSSNSKHANLSMHPVPWTSSISPLLETLGGRSRLQAAGASGDAISRLVVGIMPCPCRHATLPCGAPHRVPVWRGAASKFCIASRSSETAGLGC